MRNTKGQSIKLCLAMVLACAALASAAETPLADLDWRLGVQAAKEDMESIKKTPQTNMAGTALWERQARRLRDAGISFHERHPEDRRWKAWLFDTLWYEPSYWHDPERVAEASFLKDQLALIEGSAEAELIRQRLSELGPAEIDAEAVLAWEQRMSILRDEFIASNDTTLDERRHLLILDFDRRLGIWGVKADSAQGRMHLLEARQREILQLADAPGLCENDVPMSGESGFGDDLRDRAFYTVQELDPASGARAAFLHALAATKCLEVSSLASARLEMSENASQIGHMVFESSNERHVDLNNYRGKALLVHYWSMNCSGSTNILPALRQLQERYGEAGLEIVGFSLDENPVAVEAYTRSNGYDWPQRVDSTAWLAEARALGFNHTSNLVLLDRDGQFVAFETYDDPAAVAQRLNAAVQETLRR